MFFNVVYSFHHILICSIFINFQSRFVLVNRKKNSLQRHHFLIFYSLFQQMSLGTSRHELLCPRSKPLPNWISVFPLHSTYNGKPFIFGTRRSFRSTRSGEKFFSPNLSCVYSVHLRARQTVKVLNLLRKFTTYNFTY